MPRLFAPDQTTGLPVDRAENRVVCELVDAFVRHHRRKLQQRGLFAFPDAPEGRFDRRGRGDVAVMVGGVAVERPHERRFLWCGRWLFAGFFGHEAGVGVVDRARAMALVEVDPHARADDDHQGHGGGDACARRTQPQKGQAPHDVLPPRGVRRRSARRAAVAGLRVPARPPATARRPVAGEPAGGGVWRALVVMGVHRGAGCGRAGRVRWPSIQARAAPGSEARAQARRSARLSCCRRPRTMSTAGSRLRQARRPEAGAVWARSKR